MRYLHAELKLFWRHSLDTWKGDQLKLCPSLHETVSTEQSFTAKPCFPQLLWKETRSPWGCWPQHLTLCLLGWWDGPNYKLSALWWYSLLACVLAFAFIFVQHLKGEVTNKPRLWPLGDSGRSEQSLHPRWAAWIWASMSTVRLSSKNSILLQINMWCESNSEEVDCLQEHCHLCCILTLRHCVVTYVVYFSVFMIALSLWICLLLTRVIVLTGQKCLLIHLNIDHFKLTISFLIKWYTSW